VADQSMSVPVTLSDLGRQGTRVKIFWQISVINTFESFDLELLNLAW